MFTSLLLLGGLLGQPAVSTPSLTATVATNSPTPGDGTTRQQQRRARRARRANGPEVYKGTTASQYRVVAEGGTPDGPVREKEVDDSKSVAKNSKRIK